MCKFCRKLRKERDTYKAEVKQAKEEAKEWKARFYGLAIGAASMANAFKHKQRRIEF